MVRVGPMKTAHFQFSRLECPPLAASTWFIILVACTHTPCVFYHTCQLALSGDSIEIYGSHPQFVGCNDFLWVQLVMPGVKY